MKTKTKDETTAVTVTTTKTVKFKIKGVAIEMTPQELEALYQQIGNALGKQSAGNSMDEWKKIAERMKHDNPHWERPFYAPPHYTMPEPTFPYKGPMCLTAGDPESNPTRTISAGVNTCLS